MTTWNDIELINAVMDSGTLSGAARLLDIDQTTASRRLARIEQIFGSALFDRHGGKLTPTPQLLLAKQSILNMANASALAKNQLFRAQVELAGSVTISCLGFYAANILAPHLNKLLRLHPQINVNIVSEDRLTSFESREADIAIRFVWPEESIAVMRRLASIRFRRYGTKGANSINTPIVRYTELLEHQPEMQLLSLLRPDATAFLQSDRLDLLANAAASIEGELMLPEWMGDEDPRFSRMDEDTVFAERPVFVLIHPDRNTAPAVVAVKEWLLAMQGVK